MLVETTVAAVSAGRCASSASGPRWVCAASWDWEGTAGPGNRRLHHRPAVEIIAIWLRLGWSTCSPGGREGRARTLRSGRSRTRVGACARDANALMHDTGATSLGGEQRIDRDDRCGARAMTFVVYGIAVFMILGEVASSWALIAGAGHPGRGVRLGSQSLVQESCPALCSSSSRTQFGAGDIIVESTGDDGVATPCRCARPRGSVGRARSGTCPKRARSAGGVQQVPALVRAPLSTSRWPTTPTSTMPRAAHRRRGPELAGATAT